VIRFVDQAVESGHFRGLLPNQELQDDFKAARLYLLAMTWVSLWNPDEFLGVHETNLLYNHRDKLERTPAEGYQLFRALISDLRDFIPGWYWFRDWDPAALQNHLFVLALSDRSTVVQNRALEFLSDARIPPTTEWAKDSEILSLLATNKAASGLKLALQYVGEVGLPGDLPAVETLLTHEDAAVRAEAITAKLSILARHHPGYAFEELLFDSIADKKRVLSEIKWRSSDLDSSALAKALQNTDETIALFAVMELERRGELSAEQSASLLNASSSGYVKAFCCRKLISVGADINSAQILEVLTDQTFWMELAPSPFFSHTEQYTDPGEVILELYKSWSVEELLSEVEWDSTSGAIAYKALALYHFERVAARVRSDLNDRFERSKREFLGNLRMRHGDSENGVLEL
jgi:hypothetical protein